MLERAWARRWATLAFATVITVAIVIVASQPVRSPWWTYADADASYAGSALNLLAGRPVIFVDHPGLPVTEAAAIAFGADALVEKRSLGDAARLSYVDKQLLDLDRARAVFRGIGVAIYLLGAVLAFVLCARLFGHWTWGFVAGLLWVAAPGLAAMSIQLRPDVLLALLTLVFAYFVGRALETRSPVSYGLAALTVGFTVMVKLHALALLVPLALATAWRPPDRAAKERMRTDVERFVRRRRVLVGAIVSAWVLLAILLNWNKFPFTPEGSQLRALGFVVALVSGYSAAAYAAERLAAPRTIRALFDRFPPFLGVALLTGLLLPVTLSIDDGLRSLVYIERNLRGEGVQTGIEPFSTPFSQLDDIVGGHIVVFFLIAALAGAIGVARRDPRPVVWVVGALAAGVFAYARPPNVHYFAPAFMLCIPAVLWLLQRGAGARASLLVWPIALYVFWPAYEHRLSATAETERFAAIVAPAKAYVEPRLKPGEVALVPSYWPFADSRYFELVKIYADYVPNYPYRYLPTTSAGLAYASERAVRPRYFIGPQASNLTGTLTTGLGEFGQYSIRPAPGQAVVAEIVAGPGVDRPWP